MRSRQLVHLVSLFPIPGLFPCQAMLHCDKRAPPIIPGIEKFAAKSILPSSLSPEKIQNFISSPDSYIQEVIYTKEREPNGQVGDLNEEERESNEKI